MTVWSNTEVATTPQRATPLRLSLLACCLLLVVSSTVGPSSAGATDLAPSLDLLGAIQATFQHHPSIELYAAQVEVGSAAVASARSSFDHVFEGSIGTDQQLTPDLARNISHSSALNLGLSGTRNTPWGMTLAPWATVTRTDISYLGSGSTQVESEGANSLHNVWALGLGFTLNQALLKGRGRIGAAGLLVAAETDFERIKLYTKHQVTGLVLNTVAAFWTVLAAQDQLAAHLDSKERNLQLLEETKQLVAADERPAADLKQIQASLAEVRARVVTARSNLFAAQQQLLQALGPSAIPTQALPLLRGALDTSSPEGLELTRTSNFIQKGLARRLDLQAAQRSVDRSAALLRTAERNVAPDLDLSLGLSYSRPLGTDADIAAASSFGLAAEDVIATAGLTVGLPLENRAARATLLSEQAALRIAEIARDELQRAVEIQLAVALDKLSASRTALSAAQEAVALYKQSVANERVKLREGMATVVDVIVTEDRMTAARLAAIAVQLDYALALADLHYQVGMLPSSLDETSSSVVKTLTGGGWHEQE